MREHIFYVINHGGTELDITDHTTEAEREQIIISGAAVVWENDGLYRFLPFEAFKNIVDVLIDMKKKPRSLEPELDLRFYWNDDIGQYLLSHNDAVQLQLVKGK